MKRFARIYALILALLLTLTAVGVQPTQAASPLASQEYKGKMAITVNKNKPSFSKKQKKLKKVKVTYSRLDKYGRCGRVFAVLDKKHMAKGKRGSIGMYKPSGWPNKIGNSKYDFIDGKYLFNRSHLLGWQLYGNKTNNKKNLVTGTRAFNAGPNGMLVYENKVANYLKKHKKNHVVYRVTPVYRGKELIPRGVQMEAWSVEDKGKLKFNVYIHNVQDGVTFSYFNGESRATNAPPTEVTPPAKQTGSTIFILNISTGKFHRDTCRYANSNNTEQTNLTAQQLIADGYSPCQVCHPDE